MAADGERGAEMDGTSGGVWHAGGPAPSISCDGSPVYPSAEDHMSEL